MEGIGDEDEEKECEGTDDAVAGGMTKEDDGGTVLVRQSTFGPSMTKKGGEVPNQVSPSAVNVYHPCWTSTGSHVHDPSVVDTSLAMVTSDVARFVKPVKLAEGASVGDTKMSKNCDSPLYDQAKVASPQAYGSGRGTLNVNSSSGRGLDVYEGNVTVLVRVDEGT